MSIPTRGLWQYSYAVPAEMEALAWRNPECDSSRLSDPETLASWSIYTAASSGIVSCFTKKSGLAVYNIFSRWAFSSAKNAGKNNRQKILGTYFLLFPKEKGVDKGKSTSFQPRTPPAAIPCSPSFLTLMRVAHHFSVCRNHCTKAKQTATKNISTSKNAFPPHTL